MVKAFFSVDAHGSTRVWRKWLSVPKFHNAEVLMLCGDLTGKALVPLVKQKDGTHLAYYFGRKWELKNEREVKKMEERLSASGVYPYRCTSEEVARLQKDPREVEKVMKEAIVERTREWIDLLVERIDTKKIKAIMMPGNDDYFEVDDVIKAYEDEGVIYPLDKVVDIAGFETISLDYTNPTPWNTPREASEKELKKKIDKLVNRLSDPNRSIFNFHCPPYNTRLDLAPELDKQMKPVLIGGRISMIHVGSKAVREAIEKYRPMIGLHGHIHESHAVDKIADVPVLNPGSEYGEGLLRGFIIEMSKKGVERYWKVEG